MTDPMQYFEMQPVILKQFCSLSYIILFTRVYQRWQSPISQNQCLEWRLLAWFCTTLAVHNVEKSSRQDILYLKEKCRQEMISMEVHNYKERLLINVILFIVN